MARGIKDINYNCESTDKPPKRMGEGQFANMPKERIVKKFPDRPCLRGGLINGFVCDISDISDIEENGR